MSTSKLDYTISESAIRVLSSLTDEKVHIASYPMTNPILASGGTGLPRCTQATLNLLIARRLVVADEGKTYPYRYRISQRGRLALALAAALNIHQLSTADALILRDLAGPGAKLHWQKGPHFREERVIYDDRDGRHTLVRQGIKYDTCLHLAQQKVIHYLGTDGIAGPEHWALSEAGRAVARLVERLEEWDRENPA